jgi:hypothetical protein
MRFRIILALAPSVFCRRRLVGTSAANKRSLHFGGAKWNRLRQDSAVGEASFFFDVQKSQEPVTLEFLMTTTPKSRGNSALERPPRSTIAPKT